MKPSSQDLMQPLPEEPEAVWVGLGFTLQA